MENANDILLKIKDLLQERNWSVYRLAKESDITYSSLNSMFLKNTYPTIPTLEKICHGLNISLSDFFANKPLTITPKYTDDEAEIVDIYRQLPAKDKELLKAYLKGFAKIHL